LKAVSRLTGARGLGGFGKQEKPLKPTPLDPGQKHSGKMQGKKNLLYLIAKSEKEGLGVLGALENKKNH